MDKAVKTLKEEALEALDRLTEALSIYEDAICELPFCIDADVDWNDAGLIREALEQLKGKE